MRHLEVPRPAAIALLLSTALLLPGAASAQSLPGLPGAKPAATPVPTPAPDPAPEAADSPRSSARAMIELTARKGDFKGAARYLQLPAGEEARGPELARRLRAVLERHLDIDLDAVSPFSEGNTQDGLPPGVDAVGEVPDGRGGHDPVFIVRSRDSAGTYWAFSRQTVSRVDGWYDALPDRWVRDWMPEHLQRYGPRELMWWQWLAIPVLLVLALVLGRILGAFSTAVLQRLFKRTSTEWDEQLLRYTRRFDRWSPASAAELEVAPAACRQALGRIGGAEGEALETAAARIRAYHQHLHLKSWRVEEADGTMLGQQVTPLDRVGLYVPGGKAVYPSSVVMNAIPASVVEVPEIIMVTPPGADGRIRAEVLMAARVAWVHRVFTMGGAHAIAALAYGTESVPRVDKITGPGSVWVLQPCFLTGRANPG